MIDITRILVGALALGVGSMASHASTDMLVDTRGKMAQSDLVFVGKVREVNYARSAGESGIPHTFVTYDVERVLHGVAMQKQVTLRFIGGRGDKAQFLMVSDTPLFDLGDQDILIVSKNNVSGCPLVDCSEGRLRIINDKIFTEGGQAVERNSQGILYKTEYFELPEVNTHKVSMTTLKREDHLEYGESRRQFVAPGRGEHLSKSEMLQRLDTEVKSIGRATVGTFETANINRSFTVSLASAVPAPEKSEATTPARSATAQEMAEIAALERNGENPVLSSEEELNVRNATYSKDLENDDE